MKKTVNYNLNKPEYTDFADVVNDNQNMDTLDQLIFLLNQDKVDKVVGKGLSANDLTDLLKAKLDGIATGANNYTHPASHSASIINETATRKFVSSDEKIAWDAKWNFNEGEIKTIKVNSALNADTVNGKTVAVNVPASAKFTDTIVDTSELKFSELSATATNKDTEDIYINTTWKRKDNTVYAKSTLIGTTPLYNQIKVDYYNDLGTSIIKTITWNLFYDSNDFIYKKEVV